MQFFTNMKIAICLSGQMRAAIYAFPNIKNFLGDLINSADFFIHTWDVNSEKSVSKENFRKEFVIPKDELLQYVNLYKPKKFELEKASLISKNLHPDYFKLHTLIKSIKLKQEYEISNGFTYDVVIKLRPDMIVDPSITIYSIINELDFTDDILFSNDVINGLPDDVIWFSNSKVMDIISKYPNRALPDVYLHTNHYAYLYEFKFYLEQSHIIMSVFGEKMRCIFNVTNDKWSIMRTEAIHYHSLNEYKKCVEIDRNIYWEPDPNIAPFMQYLTEEEWRTIVKNMFQLKGFVPPRLEYLK